MFIVAISPLIFSPGDGCGVLKSIRLAGVSADPLILDGPGTLVAEGTLTATLPSLAEITEDDVEEPVSVCEVRLSLCGLDLFLLLLLLLFAPLLG